eukprot:482816-Prymnesium_polylepis.1
MCRTQAKNGVLALPLHAAAVARRAAFYARAAHFGHPAYAPRRVADVLHADQGRGRSIADKRRIGLSHSLPLGVLSAERREG